MDNFGNNLKAKLKNLANEKAKELIEAVREHHPLKEGLRQNVPEELAQRVRDSFN